MAPAGCRPSKKPTGYADAARAEYDKGKEQFDDDNFLEAIKTFSVVRTRHPYSRFATLAELRIADAHYELGKFAEAAASYRAFVRFHPHHTERAYAMYRVGDCFYQQIPGNWWFMPPAHERELGSTSDALRELGLFVRSYPRDERVPDAREKMTKLRRRLADYELYVARFYRRLGKQRGVVMRTDHLVRTYPDVGLTPVALLLKARAQLEIPERDAGVTTLRQIVREHAHSDEARQARQDLERLGEALAAPVPEAAPAGEAPAAPASQAPAAAPAPAGSPTPAAPATEEPAPASAEPTPDAAQPSPAPEAPAPAAPSGQQPAPAPEAPGAG